MFHETVWLAVVAGEFFDDIGADIAVFLFDSFGRLETAVGLTAISKKRLDKVGNVTAGDRDALDGRANNIAFCNGDDVGDTIARVNNSAGQGAI